MNLPYDAEIRVTAASASRIAERTAHHMKGHGAQIAQSQNRWRIDFGLRSAEISVEPAGLILRAYGADASLLREMQLDLAEHVAEFGGPALPHWTADDGAAPPNFRLLTVEAAVGLTPLMRRIRFSGNALLRFDRMDALHCKLLVPPPGQDPVWPAFDKKGGFHPGNGTIRKYTIRRIDAAAGLLDIDFVLHRPAGPASVWAEGAVPGDSIGMIGPGGGGIPLKGPLVLAGDETALPAIARALRSIPQAEDVTVLIEVDNEAEAQTLSPSGTPRVTWLHRNGTRSGEALTTALSKLNVEPSTFVWVGCEFQSFLEIRTLLRKSLNHPRDHHLVTAYWRKE